MLGIRGGRRLPLLATAHRTVPKAPLTEKGIRRSPDCNCDKPAAVW